MTAPIPQPCHVLLAEGDRRAAATLARLLRGDGYVVETVHDGATALARLAQNPVPDVLLLDERLPSADGLAVATAASRRHPTPHVVIITIYPELAMRFRHAALPAFAVLAKPLAYGDLAHELRQWRGQRGLS